MPEYQYECELCNTEFSIFKPMLESCSVYCPKCKTMHVKRVFNSTPVIYKGKGFYKTDSQKPLTDNG